MLDIERFAHDVHVLTQAISMEAEDANTARQVELAFFLWRMVNEAQEVLDGIKDHHLRPVAVKRAGGQPGQEILSGTGTAECQVNIPEPSYRIKKGSDLEALRQALGPRFEEFFQENLNVQPRREAGNLVAQLTDDDLRSLLLNSLVEFIGTPRVTLREVDQDQP